MPQINSARARVVAAISELLAQLAALEREQVFEAYSRWRYGRFLDAIAALVSRHLCQLKAPTLGACSFFYREAPNRYVLGGSSTERWRMDYAARFYELSDDAHTLSFTAWALRFAQPLAFDDFHDARKRHAGRVAHTSKRCDLPESTTHSYVAIPHLADPATLERRLRAARKAGRRLPGRGRVPDTRLPRFLMRLTYDRRGVANNTISILLSPEGRRALNEIFRLVEKGYDHLPRNRDCATAIADLNGNLLRFMPAAAGSPDPEAALDWPGRKGEYGGLQELACHLQSLFGECECSVFLAHLPTRTATASWPVRLYLAATSALGESGQHAVFRRHFLEEKHYYTCDPELEKAGARLGKTATACLHPESLVRVGNCQGSGLFGGKGEIQDSGSFMAVAVPGASGGLPYGVIRWVRRHPVPFSKAEGRLAVAIAKTLSYWTRFYPRNDALEIAWRDERLRQDVLRALFGLEAPPPVGAEGNVDEGPPDPARAADGRTRFEEPDIEFSNLLRKLFPDSHRVLVRQQFGGGSGAVVLLVSHDAGQDLIVKCGRLAKRALNQVDLEVSNYRDWIEGKLRPSHNLIYPHHVRETWGLNGFATTFLGGTPLSDCASAAEPVEWRFETARRSIDHVVREVWAWWYERQEGPVISTVPDFLRDALRPGDGGWHMEDGEDEKDKKGDRVKTLGSNVFDAMRSVLKVGSQDLAGLLPGALWDRFDQWARSTEARIEWHRTVTHGDLHGGNLFVNPPGLDDVWIIDFARTGWRVSIFDLAQLEAYLKLEYLPVVLRSIGAPARPAEFVARFRECERTLARQRAYETITIPKIGPDPADPKVTPALAAAYRAVNHIRCLAVEQLHRRGAMLDYLVTLLVVSFWYLSRRGVSGSVQERSALGMVMARESIHQIVDALTTRWPKEKGRTPRRRAGSRPA